MSGRRLPAFRRAGELVAALHLSGLHSAFDACDPEQTVGGLDVGADEPGIHCPRPGAVELGAVPPIVMSELLKDIAGLWEA